MCIAGASSPLPADHGTSKMEQSAPTKAPYRRKDSCDSTTYRSHAKPSRSPDASEILEGSSSLATLTMDLLVSCSKVRRARPGLSHPTTSRDSLYAGAEHILPLVRWAPELPWRKIRSGGVCCGAGMLAAKSSCGSGS